MTPGKSFLALAVLSLLPMAAAAQDVGLPIGSVPAPAVVEDLEGGQVDLSELLGGKPTLVEFWATWCPLCRALEPRLQAASGKHGEDVDILIVAVGVNQTPRRIRRHLEEHPLPGRVVFDAKGSASRAFQAPTTSYIVVLDRKGRVVYTGVGGDQDIEQAIARALKP